MSEKTKQQPGQNNDPKIVNQPGRRGGNPDVPSKPGGVRRDAVQESSEESFPASDPPSWTPTTGS